MVRWPVGAGRTDDILIGQGEDAVEHNQNPAAVKRARKGSLKDLAQLLIGTLKQLICRGEAFALDYTRHILARFKCSAEYPRRARSSAGDCALSSSAQF